MERRAPSPACGCHPIRQRRCAPLILPLKGKDERQSQLVLGAAIVQSLPFAKGRVTAKRPSGVWRILFANRENRRSAVTACSLIYRPPPIAPAEHRPTG